MSRAKQIFFVQVLLWCLAPLFMRAENNDPQDQLYAQRLASLKSPIELTYNETVRFYIERYLNNSVQTAELLGRCQYMLGNIEKVLREKQLPVELKYVMVAATGASNDIVSPTGAAGYWRMMYNVARTYGLKINSFVDERKDPLKSSQAATAYLKDLNGIYNNWHLSLAAYGCTPAILNKAIRQSGYKMNFWEVYPLLPEDSKSLVPEFIAAAYIFNFFKEHNISPTRISLLQANDTITVNKWLSFQQISSALDIRLEELRELNPIFKKDVIPYAANAYVIKLPKGKARYFYKLRDSVYIYVPKPVDMAPVSIQRAGEPKPAEPVVNKPAETPAEKEETAKKEEKEEKEAADENKGFNKKRLYYTVKSGDVLGDIADWYDVSLFQVKSWNKLRSNKIRRGQRLTIWVPAEKLSKYSRIDKMSKAQKNSLRRKD